ncbi:methyltransferase domain-containing protein [Bacteroidota bacterium]
MGRKNDRVLRIYNEVLGLERLHYGIWQSEDELSIENLKTAQESYETYLINNIPENVKTILDVGCGTGIMSKKLVDLGYEVEGLSPDINQKELFTKNLNAKFHHSSFEDFSPLIKYDCLIMSESAQYIRKEKLFEVANQALNENSYLMVCDYFVLNDASGIFAKSGHNYENFMKLSQNNGFKVILEKDITEDITKTLDIANLYVEKIILALEILSEKTRKKHPHLTRFAGWIFRKKIEGLNKQRQLLDSNKFKENKTYRFMLLQMNS